MSPWYHRRPGCGSWHGRPARGSHGRDGRVTGSALRAAAAALLAGSVLAAGPPAGRETKPLPTTRTRGGVVMVRIPAGEFRMGSADGEVDERPVHPVRLDAFYMDRTLVTQAEYQRLMGHNPCKRKGRPANPVEQVSWAKAALYCNARSREAGLESCYDTDTWACDFSKAGYRLPTEAEWEYACRAGTTTKWHFGRKPEMLQVYAWFKRNSGKRPRPVGRKSPNPWGLADMGGNLWQWCNDYYARDYYRASPPRNPRGPKAGGFKVVRGGSWNSPADHCRSAARFKENPAFVRACFGRDEYGFRCVRGLPAAASRPAAAAARRGDP